MAPKKKLPYVLVRGDRSGVFCGELKERNGREVLLLNVRWIWYWDGAASLSQLVMDGPQKPENCKFPVEVPERLILDAIDIMPVSDKARKKIKAVPVWER